MSEGEQHEQNRSLDAKSGGIDSLTSDRSRFMPSSAEIDERTRVLPAHPASVSGVRAAPKRHESGDSSATFSSSSSSSGHDEAAQVTASTLNNTSAPTSGEDDPSGSNADQSAEQSADESRLKKRKHLPSPAADSSHKPKVRRLDVYEPDHSSGSGTDAGYAGEASSSDKRGSCSSPSLSSGDDRGRGKANRNNSESPSSSSIPDDDSSDPLNYNSDGMVYETSSAEGSSDDLEPYTPRKLSGLKMELATRRKFQGRSVLQTNYESAMFEKQVSLNKQSQSGSAARKVLTDAPTNQIGQNLNGKPAIFSLSSDLMVHCMTFLEPPQVHDLLTMPLSREWRSSFTMPQDVWRVLCLTEPFKAKFEPDGNDSDDSSASGHSGLEVKHLLGQYRLLYTSFVKCLRYLERIKDDVMNGRPPSAVGYGGATGMTPLRKNENLKTFLRRARSIIVKNKQECMSDSDEFSSDDTSLSDHVGVTDQQGLQTGVTWVPASGRKRKKKPAVQETVGGPKFGHSQLTQRPLGPSKDGQAGNVNLPWSCAIYSIVNWMVVFADVEGIQTMCLKALSFLLEDESQRTTAQRAGLTDIVLRGMLLFPDSVQLHTAAFHAIVLLARPLGGREGMLFHCSMVSSSGIFHDGSSSGKNGIAIMLDSMRRFQSDEVLQAMSCWSLVNVALAPSQKAVLVKLGGISVVANSMMQHPFDAEVQFRALFALINLVIPSVNLADGEEANANQDLQAALGEVNTTSEKEMLDDAVGQIANLVVVAMKNFCASESILNRACLVLHNLSLTDEYHTTLLWTPNCYQMLDWCLANYRTDQVLQQSAAGTLHRLQATLSANDDLRQRFASSLQSQQQTCLERVHREAQLLHQREGQLSALRIQAPQEP
ncbi:hypothetical protein MHU86_16746 [Fragilaria crotonensis]|nr:hypothetical protein MHU86_16746 [Fragilaria crotonensis]